MMKQLRELFRGQPFAAGALLALMALFFAVLALGGGVALKRALDNKPLPDAGIREVKWPH